TRSGNLPPVGSEPRHADSESPRAKGPTEGGNARASEPSPAAAPVKGAERDAARELAELAERVSRCRACPRLVAWREGAAANPPKRCQGERYWARPAPGFGDPAARIAIVGLAPAAHGANRTGRMFTGDRSGDW